MTLSWKNIYIDAKNTNKSIKTKYINLINDCSGEAKRGEIYAIMGSSGSGKSSLLDGLSGRVKTGTITQGSISYNDEPRKMNEWIEKIGFVDQDDIIYEQLTLLETIRYAAKFRLKKKKRKEEDNGLKNTSFNDMIERKINKMIDSLQLSRCCNTKMMKISGGERKRAMIGIEMISEPDVLFIDEPTSGLDSFIALNLIKMLKKVAVDNNMIVILTIHQPSSSIFNLFDNLMLLSKGFVVFNGKISQIDNFIAESGLEKRNEISYPEFLMEISDGKKNIRINRDVQSILKNDDRKIAMRTSYKWMKYEFNIYHIYLLLCRFFHVESKRKLSYIKSLSILIVNYILLYVCFIFILRLVTTKASQTYTTIQNNAPIILFCIPHKNEILFLTFLLLATIYNFFMGTAYLKFTSFTFLDIINISKREINVGTYTPSSLYLCHLFLNIIVYIISSALFIGGVYITIPRSINYVFTLFILLYGVFMAPMGLLIGSITFRKKIVLFICSLLGIFFLISPVVFSFFTILNKAVQPENTKNGVLYYISMMFPYILPFYNYLAVMSFTLFKSVIDENGNSYAGNEHYTGLNLFYICFKNSLPEYMNRIWVLGIFLLFIVSIWILAGILLLTRNLMPEMRLEMERNKKKIT